MGGPITTIAVRTDWTQLASGSMRTLIAKYETDFMNRGVTQDAVAGPLKWDSFRGVVFHVPLGVPLRAVDLPTLKTITQAQLEALAAAADAAMTAFVQAGG